MAAKVSKNQNERIMTELQKKGFITKPRAAALGIVNLSARISDLRNSFNMDIVTDFRNVRGTKRVETVYKIPV
jgi:hypothetical protein